MLSLARRALSGLGVVLGVVTLMFALLRLAPGDPALLLVGPAATPTQVAAQRHALGLDRPLAAQYATWLGRFARGDWGTSIATGRPVRAMLGAGVAGDGPAGRHLARAQLSDRHRGRRGAGGARAAGWTPRSRWRPSPCSRCRATGSASCWSCCSPTGFACCPRSARPGFDADFLPPAARLADRLRHLALPLATLTLVGIGGTARFVRGAMLDVAGEPYVMVARSKGLSETRVTLRHVLRNALIPVVTLLGLSLPALFSGAVFIEAIFAWPGVGRVLVEAVQARDYPVVMAATAVSAALVVAGNLLAEALVSWADPRAR